MKKSAQLFCLLFALVFGACQSGNAVTSENAGEDAGNLTVSAAVSLKDAFAEIGELYREKTGKTINFNYGSSGALQKQIETGAPVDVFASAGEKQMNELAGKNLIDAATRRDFTRNTLVLIVPRDSKSNVAAFPDLRNPDVQKIAVGNPKTVPAGEYAEEFFSRSQLRDDLQPKLIFAEDVRQVLDYVARGETDAGVVYGSDALAAREKVRVVAAADEKNHQPIRYPIAVVKDSRRKQSARDFINLVGSAQGQEVLRRRGFAASEE